MTPAAVQRLMVRHARALDDHTRLTRARDRETDDNRRAQLADDAAECMLLAMDVAEALADAAPHVAQPEPNQLTLLGLGLS